MRKTTYLKTFLLTVMLITGLGSNAIAQTWELVKDLNDLSINDEVVLVSSNYSNAMSTTQNTNNRGIEAITKTGETVAINSNVQQFTIVAGTVDNTYAFSTGTGYLNAASSSANYLRTEATLSANSSWLISISNIGVASMTAQGSYTRNVMQYNNGSSIFACYGSASQTGVSIYKKVNQVSSFPAPTITPASGHYRTAQSVTMSSYGNDTTIYYTLNGDDPKAQGTVLTAYTAPFSVSSATTVKAIAVSGTDTSDVATATYTFPIEVSNIAAFLAAGVAENSASATTYNGTKIGRASCRERVDVRV